LGGIFTSKHTFREGNQLVDKFVNFDLALDRQLIIYDVIPPLISNFVMKDVSESFFLALLISVMGFFSSHWEKKKAIKFISNFWIKKIRLGRRNKFKNLRKIHDSIRVVEKQFKKVKVLRDKII